MRILWPRKGTKRHKLFCYLVFVLLRAFLWLKLSGFDYIYPREVRRFGNMQWHWFLDRVYVRYARWFAVKIVATGRNAKGKVGVLLAAPANV
ncbi:Unannotated [Lentimonas sp. CC19]|nr:Unannotated [Lentimonas sp. CC4]CAA6684409.1 Unannotated [Lentimonas sp. CC6]CAA6692874.1 Unannotated [Lentimonas sp. CC19]CAA6695778.1 Unannotated [Lentimonas sp. CC10]CAA7069609.1 Unannotated [Lentimonas sp. CC11]CAA7171346.1 Unannotated [Lentimonas sp. CC21]CAA7183376.1 Unannotated [Lentimonas sp. CC8]